MPIHRLKTEQQQFLKHLCGLKPYEIRLNDRNYQVGDILILQEYIASLDYYTGQYIECIVSDVFDNARYLNAGYVLLVIKYIEEIKEGGELNVKELSIPKLLIQSKG